VRAIYWACLRRVDDLFEICSTADVICRQICYSRLMSHLDELFDTPPADLIAKLKALRDQRAGIESRESIIEQLLDVRVQQGGVIAEEIAALGASSGIGPLRNQIVQVLTSKRDESLWFMVPQAVHDELRERGNRTVTLDNVRVTMRRMADSGELERARPGALLFGLPGAIETMPPGLLEAVLGGQKDS